MRFFAVLLGLQAVLAVATVVGTERTLPKRGLAYRQALAIGLAFPLAGPVTVWWLLTHRDRRPIWLNDLPSLPAPPEVGVDAAMALAREIAVRPFADQLRLGVRDTRQAAARALAALGDADAVRVLEAALIDPDPDTRLFASLALVRLEAAFAARLASARDVQDPMGVARVVRTYLASGLPRGAAARALWVELARLGDAVLLDMAPASSEAWTDVAAARRALGDAAGAREAAAAAMAIAPSSEAALVLCEALWDGGQWDALPAAAAQLEALAVPGSPSHQAATYWRRP